MMRLTALRKARGWSIAKCARKADLDPARLGQIELRRYVPPQGSEPLRRVARVLGVPVADAHTLLDEVEEVTNDAAS
jgi:transcriptional regulator with XRE-family HTH domain